MAAPKNTPRTHERILLVLVLGVFAAAVVNLSLFSFRIDLTSAGAYSISPATKAVFAQAKDQISVTYYLSKTLGDQVPETQAIVDLLQEYAAASNGKVKVLVVDPKDSGELGSMAQMGLQPYTLNIVEQSQQTQVVTYSGIVVRYLNRQEVLPLVGQAQTLEYDLTTKVNKIVTQKQRTVAFLSADPSRTLQQYYTLLSQSLSQTATFREVQPGQPVGDASVLIVAGSKGFTPAVLKPVDDYLMKGGKVLFAVDGVFVDIASAQSPALPAGDNELLKALETWGVKVDQGLILDDYNNVVQFQSGQGLSLRRYPLWPELLPKNTSPTNPVTSRFSGLTLMWASPLTALPKTGIKSEVLATTSEKSWLVKDNLTIDVDRAAQSRAFPGVKFEKQNVVLALSGSFPSTQPGGGASPATRILVVGSSNILTDLMRATGKDENLVFTENAVDWLAQDEGLLGIKTRAYRDKSLTLLQDPQVRDTAAFSLSFVNLFLVPVVVLAWAVVRMVRRRRKEDRPLKETEK